jgi:alcohol dehydrogenase
LTAAGPIFLEREAGQRMRRLTASVADSARQRLRPTRRRMRALVAAPGGRLRWREVPAPQDPGPDEAVVHPISMATCDLDGALVRGATPFALPLRLGHECVAEVVSVGDRVQSVRPGQRVVVPFQINCGHCAACRAGNTGNCTTVPPVSMYGFGVSAGHYGGVLADQVSVPFADAMLVPLPSGVDPVAAASLSDTICDGYRHIAPYLADLLARDPDAPVIILASYARRPKYTPSTPLFAGLTARALGARHVYLADNRPDVRELAESLGITALPFAGLRDLPKAPLVASVTESPRGLRAALEATAPDGICSSAGGLDRSVRLPFLRLYGHNATLHIGRTHARALIPDALALMVAGTFSPEKVITSTGSLDDAPEILAEHFYGGGIKAVLTA